VENWSVEFFKDPWGRMPVMRWMEKELDEFQRAAADAAITRILTKEGINLAGTQWMKPLGNGLYEFRVRHTSEEINSLNMPSTKANGVHRAILLRFFLSFHGKRIILLLSAYDKGKASSKHRQQSEIEIARKRLKAWRRMEK